MDVDVESTLNTLVEHYRDHTLNDLDDAVAGAQEPPVLSLWTPITHL